MEERVGGLWVVGGGGTYLFGHEPLGELHQEVIGVGLHGERDDLAKGLEMGAQQRLVPELLGHVVDADHRGAVVQLERARRTRKPATYASATHTRACW